MLMDTKLIQTETRGRGRPQVDLRGMKFDKLIPFEPMPREKGKPTRWLCYCVGNHLPSMNLSRVCAIQYSALVNGRQRSCGCQRNRHRTFRDAGASELWVPVTKNDFVAFGIVAPEWALTAEQVRADLYEERRIKIEADQAEIDAILFPDAGTE
jgi:hypothetical protein